VLLTDADLEARLNASPDLVEGLDRSRPHTDAAARVQAASLDLTMGKIFLPELPSGDLGGFTNPRREHSLKPGHTAVVETAERLNLPPDLTAIGFPPSSVSARGLLLTNPGHVDPGFAGHLSFTVINMGRDPFPLKRAEPIVTLLFFSLARHPDASYQDRNGPGKPSAVAQDRLARLSDEFLQVEARAKEVARTEEARSARWTAGIGCLVIIAAALGTIFGVFLPTRSDVQNLRGDVQALKEHVKLKDLQLRVARLEQKGH
jgi:deoxycytidine triphosphate deaminase